MKRYYWLVELLVGLITGVVAAFLGGTLGSMLSTDQGMASLASAVGGMLLAFPLGVGIGMGLVAHWLYRHKRPWLGVVGALVGIFLIMLLAEPTRLNVNPTLLLTVTVIVCCLAALIALHLPRDRQM